MSTAGSAVLDSDEEMRGRGQGNATDGGCGVSAGHISGSSAQCGRGSWEREEE